MKRIKPSYLVLALCIGGLAFGTFSMGQSSHSSQVERKFDPDDVKLPPDLQKRVTQALANSNQDRPQLPPDLQKEVMIALRPQVMKKLDKDGMFEKYGTGSHVVKDEQMPTNRPPSTQHANFEKTQKIALRTHQTLAVPNGAVLDFAGIIAGRMGRKLKPLDTLITPNRLHVEMLDSNETGLAQSVLLGGVADGKPLVRRLGRSSEWTGVSRMFAEHPDFEYIFLRENDNNAAGVNILVPESSLNAAVGQYRATILSMESPNGKTQTSLVWFTSTDKQYKIVVQEIGKQAHKNLIALAETFPQ